MAKVLFVEDNERYRKNTTHYLTQAGHSIVLEAGRLVDALVAVERIEELGVEVAVLDGNLTIGDNSGKDGQKIARAIREKYPYVRIISYSGTTYGWGDIHVYKTIDNCEKLLEAISRAGK